MSDVFVYHNDTKYYKASYVNEIKKELTETKGLLKEALTLLISISQGKFIRSIDIGSIYEVDDAAEKAREFLNKPEVKEYIDFYD